jgi:hypothetical protein
MDSTDPDLDQADAAILRAAILVLRRRDWPGQAALTALVTELDPPSSDQSDNHEQET